MNTWIQNIQVFKTGLGKKKNPRTTITTTNGDVRDGPLDRLIARAQNILKGAAEKAYFFWNFLAGNP